MQVIKFQILNFNSFLINLKKNYENNKKLRCVLFSILLSMLFLLYSTYILYIGHVQEDAFILFQYAKNLASGHGIVFDQLSGNAEGATDFLWMILLSFLIYIGIDPAISAVFLNSIGLYICCHVILKLNYFKINNISITALLLLSISGGLSAAAGGFSTLAYASIYILTLLFVINKKIKMLAIASVVLALFRPDGLILAFCSNLYTLYNAKQERKLHLTYLGSAILIGTIYYLWRFNYFGMYLPLPLIVKSSMDSPYEGLEANFYALRWYIPLIVLLIYNGFNTYRIEFIAILFPSLVLFISLCFAHQSQNVGNRFQFPIIISIILLYIITYRDKKSFNSELVVIFCIPAFYFGAKIIRSDYEYLKNNDYINSLPQLIKKSNINLQSIAITEAGRIPYWLDVPKMIDLIGLNSKDVVLNGAQYVLEKNSPDLIFIHHANRFKLNTNTIGMNFQIVTHDLISISDYKGRNPVLIAPINALNYAVNNDYKIIFVRYGQNDDSLSHVYFLKSNIDIKTFVNLLEISFKSKIPYMSSLKN